MNDLQCALRLFVLFTVLCGGLYPAAVTGFARLLFPEQADGSLLTDGDGRVTGSRLLGQHFSAAGSFWPRPSATAEFSYNPLASGGSNAGPTNPEYLKTVAARVQVYRDAGVTGPLPAELVQASASGLDPHISPAAALAQVSRVARARGLDEETVRQLVTARSEGRQFGILGAPRVNVLLLNLDLERLQP